MNLHTKGGYYFDARADRAAWAALNADAEDGLVHDALRWYRRVEMGGGLRDMTRGAVLLHVGALINRLLDKPGGVVQ